MIRPMKYLLALLASPALAISVGDCINRAAAPENDWSYLYKVTVVPASRECMRSTG